MEEKAVKKGDAEAAHEAEEIAVELATTPEPALPRLIVNDATSEKLAHLGEQGGRIASMSPEGGVFDLMAGLYSKSGMPQFGVYLMGHAGDDLRVNRIGRKGEHVKRPALVPVLVGETDGTVDCDHKTAGEMIADARDFLTAHAGDTTDARSHDREDDLQAPPTNWAATVRGASSPDRLRRTRRMLPEPERATSQDGRPSASSPCHAWRAFT